MSDNIDNRAFNEVIEIIEHLSKSIQNKIPKRLIEFMQNNMDDNYEFEYNENKNIQEQKILKDTEILLSLIYKDYISSDSERKKLEKMWNKNEKEYQERFSKEIFKKKEIQKSDVSIVNYKKNIWNKFLDRIKRKLKI